MADGRLLGARSALFRGRWHPNVIAGDVTLAASANDTHVICSSSSVQAGFPCPDCVIPRSERRRCF